VSSPLSRLQDAFATLVTDGEAEEVYARSPGEAIVGVAERDARDTLAQLPVKEVLRYARGLRRKRWDDVSMVVPLSVGVIAGLEGRYDVWLRAHPAEARHTVVPAGAAEALRALVDLAHDLHQDPGEAPWAAELLVFEVLGACSRADGVSRGLQAQFAIHAIAEELRAGLVPIDPPLDPHAYAFTGAGLRSRRLARE
jgi:hypothetical protein